MAKALARLDQQPLRIEAIEREYASKFEALRHKYVLHIEAHWVQALVLIVPVKRFEIPIKRRTGERIVALDWHAAACLRQTPLDETGLGVDAIRLVCGAQLHLADTAGQTCPACAKEHCRACHPQACPRCGRQITKLHRNDNHIVVRSFIPVGQPPRTASHSKRRYQPACLWHVLTE